MAFDSEENRLGAQLIPFLVPQPIEDASIDAEDRQIAAGVYPGIAAASPAVAADQPFRGNYFENLFRRKRGLYGRLD